MGVKTRRGPAALESDLSAVDQATFEADVATILSTAHRRGARSALVSAAAKEASDDFRSEWDVYLSKWPDQRQAAIGACREAAQVLAARVSSAERMAYVRWVLTISAMVRKVVEESDAVVHRPDADSQGLIDEFARILLSGRSGGRLRRAIDRLSGG